MASTYTVKRGDTLWDIAQKYLGDPYKYKYLATINNIPNPDLIYVGQVIKLSGGSSSNTATTTNSRVVTINQFGLQADTDRTVFVTWNWSRDHTEEYKIRWWYATKDGVALLGNESTTKFRHSTYNAPSNAVKTWVHVKPISKKYKSNNKEVSYWTADWSTAKTYYFKNNPPSDPPTPTVKVEKFKLTATLDNLDLNATEIEFRVIKNNISLFKSGTAKIRTGHASYSCDILAGAEYKVRCRAVRDGLYSGWSDYTDNFGTVPSAPKEITVLKALSETSVTLTWSKVTNAKSYDIEWTTKKIYFDSSKEVQSMSIEATYRHAEITGMETGQEYFFRVRAVNDNGESAWCPIKSIIIGKKPTAPTTWSSTTTVIVGEPLTLYWVHNSVDGSSQTYAELELTIDGHTTVKTIKNTTDEEEKDKTSSYSVDTSQYTEGTKILWRVRTSGITNTYGDWSIQRTVDIYAPPTLEMSVTDSDGGMLETLEAFPFYIYALPGPETQVPVGYHVSIVSKQIYESVDNFGNRKYVNKDEAVYSKYFDTTDSLLIELSASNIDLDNNMEYTVNCVVSMNSGLTAEASTDFRVSWNEKSYIPNAEIAIDKETLVAHIRPYCEEYGYIYYEVIKDPIVGDYIKTDNVIDPVEGISVDDGITDTEQIVYAYTLAGGSTAYFCMEESTKGSLVPGVTLAVYRREFDGTFTEIASGLDNLEATFVTDPHPSLDYARYRIVAIEDETGAVGYYDVPGIPMDEHAVIIQWDEDWSSFDALGEEAQEQPAWSGSMLKLPYNVDVADNYKPDAILVEYIGRRHPVGYYGTHIGSTSTWNVEIEKSDVETLYALRRLATYMGDVYVREPSGSGYWANVVVSFSQKHTVLTIPVTLNVSRVEGGA